MFGFFKNRELDKKTQKLETAVDSLRDWGNDWGNIIEKHIYAIQENMTNFDERLKKIEFLVNIPEPESFDKPWTTTDAILKVLSSTKRELSFNEIFNSVKKYNLHVKDLSMASVKSTVYGLANKGRVDYGKDQGTFKGVSGIY